MDHRLRVEEGHCSATPDAATTGGGGGRQWEAGARRRGRGTFKALSRGGGGGRGATALALGLQFMLMLGGADACSVDKDCGKREVCHLEPGGSSTNISGQCVCHKFLYGAVPPSCIQVTAPGALETVALVLVIATFCSAWSHYLLAFKDHMRFPRPAPGESLLPRVLCLKVMFLLASLLSCGVYSVKCLLNIIFLWTAIDLQKYYDGKYAFYRMGVPLWTLGSVYWVLAIGCIWIRVAAKLHDPRQPVKGLWRLVLFLDGRWLGWVLSLGVAAPIGFLLMYGMLTDNDGIALSVGTLFIFFAIACFFVGAQLLNDARSDGEGAHGRRERDSTGTGRKRGCCRWLLPSSAIHPAPQGNNHDRGSGSVLDMDSSEEDLILEVSSANLFSSMATAQRGEGEGEGDEELGPSGRRTHIETQQRNNKEGKEAGAKRSERESGRQSPKAPSRHHSSRSNSDISLSGSLSTSEGQSKLSSKLRRVKEEARRLAWRKALLLSLGMAMFLLYFQVCKVRGLGFVTRRMNLTGTLLWLAANLNCLYYLSPPLRRWADAEGSFLLCLLGRMLSPNEEGEQ